MAPHRFSELLLGDDASPVLFVTNDFPPQRGGIQTFVRLLCDELPPERVVVHAPRTHLDREYDARCPFTVVRDPAQRLLPTPALVRRVIRTMRRHGVRQVVFGASVPLGLMAAALRREGATHLIALTHGHEVWWAALPGFRQALRNVAHHVDVMTYVSDYTGDRIGTALHEARCQFLKLRPRPDPSFHPGVDGSQVRRRHGIPQDAVVVVCVARLVRRKGQDRLVRIWLEVLERFPDAYLLLVGGGPDRRRLERMIRRRGLATHVILTGEVEETPPHYAAGDVFAMPVRNRFFGLEVEGLGISYLEAAAIGLTVVPGRHGGAPEAVETAIGPRPEAGADR